MILGFKEQFVKKIKSGYKIHTIRADKHGRWKEGNTIHFATGVRTKMYKQFGGGVCRGVQKIKISYKCVRGITVWIDDKVLAQTVELQRLARNDGFNSLAEFVKWFNKDFEGKIIHWTKYRY
uniref:Uncharacterized protein n=1 Tax=viral metagenome TaxID=1070528 RepID=A0A6M3KXB8_9ZZZZ